jgi:hypothetical protein
MIYGYYGIASRTCAHRASSVRKVFLLAVILTVLSPAQTGPVLTATILSQQDCRTGAGFHSLFIRLRLELVNHTEQDINVPFPLGGALIISRTLANARAGRHEFELNGAESPGQPAPANVPHAKHLMVSPGQRVESVSRYLQLVPTRMGEKSELTPGTHYLQIQMSFLPKNAEPTDVSQYRKVMSAPIAFDVGRQSAPVDCSESFKNDR